MKFAILLGVFEAICTVYLDYFKTKILWSKCCAVALFVVIGTCICRKEFFNFTFLLPKFTSCMEIEKYQNFLSEIFNTSFKRKKVDI